MVHASVGPPLSENHHAIGNSTNLALYLRCSMAEPGTATYSFPEIWVFEVCVLKMWEVPGFCKSGPTFCILFPVGVSATFKAVLSPLCLTGTSLKSQEKEELHRYRLMEKYAGIWRAKTKKGTRNGAYESCLSGWWVILHPACGHYAFSSHPSAH